MGRALLYPRPEDTRLLLGFRSKPSKIVATIVIELGVVDRLTRGQRARLGLKVRRRVGDLGGLAGLAWLGRRNGFALSGWKRAHPDKVESNTP
jgi:hypothetical protein